MKTAEEKLLKAFEIFRPHINGHKTGIDLFFEGIKQIKEEKESYKDHYVNSITDEIVNLLVDIQNEPTNKRFGDKKELAKLYCKEIQKLLK